MGSLIKTTIESLDVPCADQPFYFDENKTRMEEVLENIKLVKIDIPLLGVIKQLSTYATLLKKFCIQIRKS